MRAVDTNIILRLITGDDPQQEAIARALIAREVMHVPLTVVLESEWVLRSFYKLTRQQIASAFTLLSDHPGLHFSDAAQVRRACSRYVAGADFDDVIHLIAAARDGASALVTFDEDLDGEAGSEKPIPVELLT